ncbi:MAG: hypothetical protein CMH49_09255 [Myxococcales bacterium]|nr:hypothetical protein [Myxococcales bacterium]
MKLNERQACQLLGLAAPTTPEAARKAYRKLARQHHPDHGGDEERFKQISVAYHYLVEYYNSSSSTSPSAQSSKTSRRGRDTYTRNPDAQAKSKSTQSQQKQQKTADQSKTYQKEDHRQAWRQWREQVDRNTESQTKQRSTESQEKNNQKKQTKAKQQTAHDQSTHQHRPEQDSEPPHQAHNQEVVEASVVPSFGDSVKRWSEELGDRISVVSENLSQKFNRWYRKSARSLFEKGNNEKLRLDLDLTTLLYGKQIRIAVNRLVPCPKCQQENGQARKDPETPAALWADGCQRCNSSGRIQQREELSIYVPPGADKGHQLKVNAKGSAGLNGSSDGDLTLILTPETLPKGFRRNGADLELRQAVSASLLARGGVLKVHTLRGTVNVKIPKNFQSGKKLLIPEQGFPVWNNPEQSGTLTLCLIARSQA